MKKKAIRRKLPAKRAAAPKKKVGDKVVLSAKPSSWDDFFDAKPEGAQGFLGRRNDRLPQKRKSFK